ncbi:lipocalin family protein [uncultured Cytophaga sp.]|uniref:lipocalin family protein n=1 Tax=uncultured Cytophaga sp. TaxID=160238 RepID=UPI002630410E|nr:lipocalin family protein [uncultured Cytophaga sp.]
MKKIILSIAILATFFTACKKKKDDPAPKTTTDYLTAHSWKTSDMVSNVDIDYDKNPNTPDSKDIRAQSKDCAKDDIIVFLPNGTGVSTDAGLVCYPDDPNTTPFTWTLNGNKIVLTFNQISYTSEGTIVYIDDNTLKITFSPDIDNNGVIYSETDTLIK